MRPKLAIIALAVGILAPFASVVAATPSAWALDCNINLDTHTFYSYFWTRTGGDVYGVRAPVEKRTDGEICSNSTAASQRSNWTSIWISLFDPNSLKINQAGMMHVELPNGNHTWCRAYAGGTGTWVSYDCGSASNDTQVWFSIHPTTDGLHYHIDDCGTSGGYGSCSTEFGNDSVYFAPTAATFVETYYGCEMLIMGSQGDTQAVGGTNYHIQGLANNGTGGTEWTARQWGDQGAYYLDAQGSHPSTCGAADYKSTEINSGEILKFWDARNNT